MLKALEDLYRHMEWADAVVWTTVCSSEAAQEDDYVIDMLFHIHMTQRAFLHVWEEREFKFLKRAEFESDQAVRDWARGGHRAAQAFLDRREPAALDETVAIPWARFFASHYGREADDVTLGETALQVAMHSTHHRAQVNRRLRELGLEPSPVDYIIWKWLGRPEPEWP